MAAALATQRRVLGAGLDLSPAFNLLVKLNFTVGKPVRVTIVLRMERLC